jgi:hypothetical protein
MLTPVLRQEFGVINNTDAALHLPYHRDGFIGVAFDMRHHLTNGKQRLAERIGREDSEANDQQFHRSIVLSAA